MGYFKYLFSDKKALLYWFVAFLFIVGYTFFGYTVSSKFYNQNICFLMYLRDVAFFTACFVGYYSMGFLNLKKQEWFLKKYSTLIVADLVKEFEVLLYLESFSVKPFRGNYDVEIKPNVKKEKFKVFIFEDKICVLGYSYDFDVFKRHVPPLIISLSSNEITEKFKFAMIPKGATKLLVANNLELSFKSKPYGIMKIVVLDWGVN